MGVQPVHNAGVIASGSKLRRAIFGLPIQRNRAINVAFRAGIEDFFDFQRQAEVHHIGSGSTAVVIGINAMAAVAPQSRSTGTGRDLDRVGIGDDLARCHVHRCLQEADMQGLVCCKVHARHRSGKSIQGVAGLGFTHLIAVCICDEVGISVGGQRNLARSSRHTCVGHAKAQIGLAGEGVGILKGEVRHGGVAQIGHHQVIEQASSVIHHCAAGDRSLVAAVAVGVLFHGDIALDQLHVGLDAEGGGIGAALHIEEREGGHFAVFQVVGVLIQAVQLDRLGVAAMGAAQVQSQNAVDVHVHIIIAGEGEV